MAAEIPYRVWYPVSEMAQLRGCSEVMIRRMVRNGQRTRPTEPFIPADCVDHNGAQIVIHRSIAFTSEPGPNVAQFGMPIDLQVHAAVNDAIRYWIDLALGFLERRKAA
jgi:hypothetical protein